AMLTVILLLSVIPLASAAQVKNETALAVREESSLSHIRAKRQFGGFGGGCCAPIIPPICCGGGYGIGIRVTTVFQFLGGGMMGGMMGGMGSCCSCCQPVCMPMCMGRGCGCGGFGGFGRKKRSAVLKRNPPALRLTYV
ncbi:hypothetical protein PFISCL1PPCAC_24081, partial [Pristionchus fissidentatus]